MIFNLHNRWKKIFTLYFMLMSVSSTLQALQDPPLRPLPGWGHEAWLSPAGNNYLLYHQAEGLFLYSMDPSLPPVYLAREPGAAWDETGTLVACANPDHILIYDLKKALRTRIPLANAGSNIVEVITGLQWSPQPGRLLCVSLIDYPQQGSDLFQVTVLDTSGQQLKTTIVPNLGWAFWLNEQEILLANFSGMAWERGHIMVWNYNTGKITELLPEKTGSYRAIAYNPRTRTLAYTIDREGETAIITYNTAADSSREVLRVSFPIRNLQWSLNNTLYFWDDLHNTIYELMIDPTGSFHLKNKAAGFLPQQGVAEKFVYFLTEPIEEPQHLYLDK